MSWKVLIGLSGLYVVGAAAIAVVGVATIDPDQGHAGGFAALALTLFAGVAVVSFLAALVFGSLLRREVAKTPVSVLLILAGSFVYWASGWFELFLPVFLIAAVSGLLGLYEANLASSGDA